MWPVLYPTEPLTVRISSTDSSVSFSTRRPSQTAMITPSVTLVFGPLTALSGEAKVLGTVRRVRSFLPCLPPGTQLGQYLAFLHQMRG
jgi:hypothetical protein